LSLGLNPLDAFERIYQQTSHCFFLESFEQDGTLGRYSFMGFEPEHHIRVENNVIHFDNQEIEDEPFSFLKTFCINQQSKGFRGGLVGYLSHDAYQYTENVNIKKGSFPDMEFGLYLDGLVFDHRHQTTRYLNAKEDRSKRLLELVQQELKPEKPEITLHEPFFQKEAFCEAVKKTKEHIVAGDAFQVVLSRKFPLTFKGGKMGFYKKLRQTNPSPYQYVLKMGEREIIGSSPEMLVRVENKQVTTFPIAGTRPRGKTFSEDKELEKSLIVDQKEKAEHAMLVDLARNDIGRVSQTGSVQVKDYAHVKKFSHVQHLVTEVNGKLNGTAVDALASMFPAGTLTGAPKVSAVNIIEKMEPQARGPYGGAVGFLSLDGSCDFAILIRTLFCNKDQAFVQAGAGIVQDSVPEKEFEEIEHKAQALLDCLKQSADEGDSVQKRERR
jgi:anthranilate synthase component I